MRRPLATLIALVGICSLATAAIAPGALAQSPDGAPARHADVRKTRAIYVDPDSQAARAAAKNPIYKPIGSRPQAKWLSENYPTNQVSGVVADYVKRATDAGRTPLLAIYAIPDRDCGSTSAGGQPDAASYRAWIDQVAAGIGTSKPIAIIEPDALAYVGMSWCTFDIQERLDLLHYAIDTLADAGAWTYLDAGNSTWHTSDEMAGLLKRAGVEDARGFSTNVANYRTTADERAHDDAIVAALAHNGITGVKYVVDTSRNGAQPKNKDWCNPPWGRLGKAPKLLFDGAFDGRLWVKGPGESDGQTADATCHGGPPAGQWWPAGAKRLMKQD